MKSRSTFKKALIYLFCALLMAELLYLQACETSGHKEQTTYSEKQYLGSESCQSCHQKEFSDWNNSHHESSMMQAGPFSVVGDFNNVTFTSGGVTSRFFKNDNKFFVNTQGSDGEYHDFEIVYTFGVAPLQQYIAKFPDGKFQCLHTAWDTKKNEWFDLYKDNQIAPEEWLHWTGGSQNWNNMCSDCHSTDVKKNFDEELKAYNTTYSVINVSCEACHGPGQGHVDFMNSPQYKVGKYDANEHLYLTSSLHSKVQVDQCARCHARREQHTLNFDHEGTFMDHYVPEILRTNIYHPDGQILDEVFEYGSFLQSKMYHMGVKCTDCHNPHSLELKATGNTLCGSCHSPAVFDSPKHHFHEINTEGAQCTSCHMPGKFYMGNDFRRDHSFRVPRPDLSVHYNTPNACNECHQDMSPAWAAEKITEWYGPDRKPHFSEVLTLASTGSEEAVPYLKDLMDDVHQPAIARATAIWYYEQVAPNAANQIIQYLESEEALVRFTAVNALNNLSSEQKVKHIAPLLKDEIRTIRIASARSMAGLDEIIPMDFQKELSIARQEYLNSLKVRADFAGGQLEKGNWYERTGQEKLAEQAYKTALEIDDHYNEARLALAYFYNNRGNKEEAIAMFKKIIEQEPDVGYVSYSLGLLLAETQKLEEAIEFFHKAEKLDGNRNPRIYYNLGLTYQHLKNGHEAEKYYLKGIDLHPDDQNLPYVLSILYIQNNRYKEAKPYISKLLSINPQDQQLRRMMQLVEQN